MTDAPKPDYDPYASNIPSDQTEDAKDITPVEIGSGCLHQLGRPGGCWCSLLLALFVVAVAALVFAAGRSFGGLA